MKNTMAEKINEEMEKIMQEVEYKNKKELEKFDSDLTIIKFFMKDFRSGLRKLTGEYLKENERGEYILKLNDLQKLERYCFIEIIIEILNFLLEEKLKVKEVIDLFGKIKDDVEKASEKVYYIKNA